MALEHNKTTFECQANCQKCLYILLDMQLLGNQNVYKFYKRIYCWMIY